AEAMGSASAKKFEPPPVKPTPMNVASTAFKALMASWLLPLNAAAPKATTKRDDPGRQDAAVASMMPRTPCSSASPPLPGTNGTELILLSAVAVLVVRLVNKLIVDGSLYHPVPVARLPK